MRLAEQLDGKRFLLTGVTGFIGEALLQRLLVDLPSTTAVALVRPKPGQSGEDRLRSVLRKPIFRAAGEADDLLKTRVEALEGDLSNVPELPSDIDVVVHCAGDVSFDPLIQDAFTTNVTGTRALVERTLEAGERGGRTVHYVHVSTAYVGGRRRGAVPERAVEHQVDWRTETESGCGWPRASRRTPASRAACGVPARRRARPRPGGPAERGRRRRGAPRRVGHRAAEGRRQGARPDAGLDRLLHVHQGDGRAARRGDRGPRHPHDDPAPEHRGVRGQAPAPGVDRGLQDGEPIILAYGRGELTEFPAAPDSVIDVVPIDHVVNAIVVAAATPPRCRSRRTTT